MRTSLNVAPEMTATPPNVPPVDEDAKENMELSFTRGGVEVKKIIYLCFLPVLRRNIFFGPENLSRITCANVTIGIFPSKLKRVYKSIKVN